MSIQEIQLALAKIDEDFKSKKIAKRERYEKARDLRRSIVNKAINN